MNGGQLFIYFMEELLEAGKRERVFYIQQTGEPYRFIAGMGQSYIDYNRQVARATGILPFFATTSYNTSVTTSHLCYYDTNHQIVESEVAHLDKLMNRLHPTTDETYWIRAWSPVVISSTGAVHLDEEKYDTYVSIDLHTDIWFPKVMGWLEEKPAEDTGTLYSNWELAACHTPRLNRFIGSIYGLTLDMGAEWIFSLGACHPLYQPMLTETGIKLDV